MSKNMNLAAIKFGMACLSTASLAMLTACTSGPMTVHEVQYYQVSDGKDANFYRLTIDADTRLGVSEYHSGWFPARSVDALFGDVSQVGGVEALKFRTQLEGLINSNILYTTENYLMKAREAKADPAELEDLFKARKRILAYPADGPVKPFTGADSVEMHYNPLKGLVTLHEDEKMVFFVSSNPDDIVGKIANFSRSTETALSVQKLGDVLKQKATDEVLTKEAVLQVRTRSMRLLHTYLTTLSAHSRLTRISKPA